MEALGGRVVLADLEGPVKDALKGSEAVVFAAGSGPRTGKDKTLLVDLWGAIKSFRACEDLDIQRYVMLSSLRAGNPDKGPEKLRPYLAAKHAADALLQLSELDYTVIRPGSLTDDPETGTVRAAGRLQDTNGSIARADVAEAICCALENPGSSHAVIEMLDGDAPTREAIDKAI